MGPVSDEATAARQVLEALRGFPALARVNSPTTLAYLRESEQKTWRVFWQEVEGLLRGPVPARSQVPGDAAADEENLSCCPV
jgi:hypothetical protein